VEESRIDPRRSFADHGVDSLAAVEFAKALADKVGLSLDETLLWNFPTIDSLLAYLENPPAKEAAASAVQGGESPDLQRSRQGSSVEEELARLERELKRRS
jgi:rhizoxin synthesis polyketide synthase RhiC